MTAIVGILRFSVLSTVENPFLIAKTRSFEQFVQDLLAPARLEARFRLFEHITLASLDAQTDRDFIILVVAPRLLPDVFKRRLDSLAASRAYLHVRYVDETDFRMKNLAADIVADLVTARDAFTTFRIDDDDAVADSFIARLRRFTAPAYEYLGISLCNGFMLDIGRGPDDVRLQQRIYPNLAVGLAYVSHRKRPRTFYEVTIGHMKLHHKAPVITDARSPAYLAVTHGSNDTGGQRTPKPEFALSAGEAQAQLTAAGYGVNLIGALSADNHGAGAR